MLCISVHILIWALSSYLYSLISNNPWMWFLWVPLGLITSIILFFAWLYLIALPIISIQKRDSKLIGRIALYAIDAINIICGIRVKVENRELLTDSKRVLYVANHKALLDPLIMYAAVRRSMTCAAKSDLWDIKPLLPLIKAFRVIKINRDNDREAARSIVEGIKLMKQDASFIIFPEGGIKTREVEQMVSIKPGAYKLATKSDAVIQPMALIGNTKVDTRKSIFTRVTVTVRFLEPITPEDYKDLNTHQIAYKVVDMVNANFPNEEKHEISEEI